MRPGSVYLRKNCILPDRLDPLTQPVGENWKLVEEIAAPVFDTMVRHLDWHFLCVLRPYRRRGFGLTEADAAQRALAKALERLAREYNAAELISVRIAKFLGFHIASVILQPRQIQQFTALEVAAGWHRMIVPSR
ncbi:MAG: hypothetical protein ABSD70_08660 [Terracidiphilus sp.]